MTVYADASLLVAAFAAEERSAAARQWLADVAEGEFATSKWCETEIASGFAMKVRRGEIRPETSPVVIDNVLRYLADGSLYLPVAAEQFDLATNLIRRSTKPLRGGDALHLAIAASRGAALWTLDRRMAEAGQALGLDVHLLF